MNLANRIIAISIAVGLSAQAWAKSDASKTEAISQLTTMRAQYIKRLSDIDSTLSRKIQETLPANFDKEISTLHTARREQQLRLEIVNRLISKIDRLYTGGDLRTFLPRALTEMATVEGLGASELALVKFMKFAAEAVRNLPEQKENILSFLEGYMNRSVSNPILPDDYLKTLNYTNGSSSDSGQPVDRADVGAFADQRIQEVQQQQAAEDQSQAE